MLYLIAVVIFATILAADVITGRTAQRPPAPYSPGPNSARKRPGRTPGEAARRPRRNLYRYRPAQPTGYPGQRRRPSNPVAHPVRSPRLYTPFNL